MFGKQSEMQLRSTSPLLGLILKKSLAVCWPADSIDSRIYFIISFNAKVRLTTGIELAGKSVISRYVYYLCLVNFFF